MRLHLRFRLWSCAWVLGVLAVTACTTTPTVSTPDTVTYDTVTYVVVRHAEKVLDGTRDPALTAAGQARALALAARLQARDIVAVYATDFRRTRDTAEPAARAHGVAVTTYDAEAAAPEFVARLQRDQPTGTVLIVGHSNTVPAIVSALCHCQVAPIDESDYGNLYAISLRRDAEPLLVQQRF